MLKFLVSLSNSIPYINHVMGLWYSEKILF